MTELITEPTEVEFPYSRSTGATLSRFLTALRDDTVIWGRRCSRCERVVVPAQDYCDTCSHDLGEWIQVGPGGSVTAFTVVRTTNHLAPAEAPFAFVLVRLDGADTDLVHLVRDVESLRHGVRVRAAWAAERQGTINDLDCFEVEG
jgi:uncharacterized OB-fold protein